MFRRLWDWLVLRVIGMTTWERFAARFNGGRHYRLTDATHATLRAMLAKDYYIIVTRRRTHLTTHLQAIAGFFLTGRIAYWSHALMNAEDEVRTDADFRLIEATGYGVHYSSFEDVFDCDAVALLRPYGFTEAEWTRALEAAASQLGKPYDTLFDCLNDEKMSCIELVRYALKAAVPDYEFRFPKFEGMLRKYRTLTPEMLYQCDEFIIDLEVRR